MIKRVQVDLEAVTALLDQKLNYEDFKVAMKHIAPETDIIDPGMIVTTDIRDDHSRFFPQLDDQNRVIGGSFE